jgi:hypothetical protein
MELRPVVVLDLGRSGTRERKKNKYEAAKRGAVIGCIAAELFEPLK